MTQDKEIIDLTADSPPPSSSSPSDHVPTPEQTPEGTDVEETNPLAVARAPPPDLLLVIFIHGFKGTDETFCTFPERMQHVLSETVPNVKAECIVFPAYETRGKLDEAVARFTDWLVTLTVARENAHGTGQGAGQAKIVLMGHSMGGLLAADTLLQMAHARPDPRAPLWPRIVALLAFDTPYLGLHPFVFRNQAAKASEYVRAAYSLWETFGTPTGSSTPASSAASAAAAAASSSFSTSAASTASGPAPPLPAPPQSLWQRLAMPAAYALGSALVAGGIGAAYARRADIADAAGWVQGHLRYVSHLWDEGEMKGRVQEVLKVEEELGVTFRTFYTLLPPSPPAFTKARTFIIVPPLSTPAARRFEPSPNATAPDEIEAHTGMFAGATNDGYYALGLAAARVVRDAVMATRGMYDRKEEEEEEEGREEGR